jgi:hypothetical protein
MQADVLFGQPIAWTSKLYRLVDRHKVVGETLSPSSHANNRDCLTFQLSVEDSKNIKYFYGRGNVNLLCDLSLISI